MLKIDFYESGQGETIVIDFPDRGLGVVDAYPSCTQRRPAIETLVHGRHLHFLCLTHPHQDHGVDLTQAMRAAGQVDRYWHTVTDVQALLFAVTQHEEYPNRFSPLLAEFRMGWANFLIDLYDEVETRAEANPSFKQRLNDCRRSEEIAGVMVHFLGPQELDQNRFAAAYEARIQNKKWGKPNENKLSAILALEYGGHLVVLGADALSENWRKAVERCRKERLPKAIILKVPHHGGQDALGHPHRGNYLDLCRPNRETKAVLFGGDVKHPNPNVFSRLKNRTTVMCLANGQKPPGQAAVNPLGLTIPGARALVPAPICNPHLGFSVHQDGRVEQNAGTQCEFCASIPAA